MKATSAFALTMGTAFLILTISACGGGAGGGGPTPITQASSPLGTPSPPAGLLYVDHNGTLYKYALPLTAGSKPLRTLVESPGSILPPQIAVDPDGRVAIATPSDVRMFVPPIVSLAPAAARLTLPLTPAITEIGPSGADLVDIEYDPNRNLWLLNNLGGEVSELRSPLSRSSVAAVTIGFGAPGTKTSGYSALVQARFDVNAALYVFAEQPNSLRAQLFKTGFPYAKPPSPTGLDLAQADFVDATQYLPTNPNPAPLILGQYFGPLASPPPGSPPPVPVNVLSQFAQPLNPVLGLFPDARVQTIVGALIADPPRMLFYTLDVADGKLHVYDLPLRTNAAPKISLPCLGGVANCNGKGEHLFLAP
jgi:hypothetical protein